MRPIFVLLLGVMMLAAGFVRAAVAQDAAVCVATYIEVMPQSMEAAVTSLKTEAAASRKDDGCQDVQVLREIGRDNRFVVLESWKDQSAFEAHGKAPHAQQGKFYNYDGRGERSAAVSEATETDTIPESCPTPRTT